jgi:site-specific recombinase XerD
MGAMREAVEGAVGEDGVVKERDPFLDSPVALSYAEYDSSPPTVGLSGVTPHHGGGEMDDISWPRANGETVSSAAGRWPVLAHCPEALAWLRIQADLGLAPRTLEAYSRGLADYLTVCTREGIEPLSAGRAEVARYVRDLAQRPHPRGATIVSIDSGVGLANATLQQRLVIVRLFYDYLIEERRRDTNPVGRGRYTPGRAFGGQRERALVSRFTKLPWIPTGAEWQQILAVARQEPLRTRLMLALAYDAGLRREELCRLQTDDLDPAYRTLRVRAETTKTRRARVVPYSEATGVAGLTSPTSRRRPPRSSGRCGAWGGHPWGRRPGD